MSDIARHETVQMLRRMKFLCIIAGCFEGARKWHVI